MTLVGSCGSVRLLTANGTPMPIAWNCRITAWSAAGESIASMVAIALLSGVIPSWLASGSFMHAA